MAGVADLNLNNNTTKSVSTSVAVLACLAAVSYYHLSSSPSSSSQEKTSNNDEEDLSVSVPAEVPPQTSTGPVGVGFSSQNAPVAAYDAPPLHTESGPAAESRLSPKGTSTQLGSALESGSLPEHTQSSPTAAASDPSSSNNYDLGYMDNDALCATCRFLLEDPDKECEGWEVNSQQNSDGGVFKCVLTATMTQSGNPKSSLFDDKCPLCPELLCGITSTLDDFHNDFLFSEHPDKINVVKSVQFDQPGSYFTVSLGYKGGFGTIINLYPVHEDEINESWLQCNDGYSAQLLSNRVIGNPGPFESNTGSDLSWQLVSSWMAKCLSSHQKCNELQSVVPPLPTRVIDVGSRGGNCPPRLHVVIDKASGHYATLSHRWGSQEMLKLEVNNLEDLKREIPWERLPKTFQDAIEATRRLGIRYIWIDSLCIIQDSPDGKDWAAESAKMTSVYENSYINFAAADAMDSRQACFFDRNPSSVRPVRLYIGRPWEVDPANSGYYYAIRSHRFGDIVAKAPLYRRGWVYQERTLAPRIIHFCSKQLYWECLESIASESFPMGLPHCIESRSALPFGCHCREWRKIAPQASDMHKSLDRSSTTSDGYLASLRIWYQVVTQYTTLDLTFERDKLVAISGLAQMHSRFLNTRYLAGMWLEHLPVQLLWSRPWFQDPVAGSYNEYIAPSWSWASIRGPVRPTMFYVSDLLGKGRKQSRPIIQILDATVDLVDENHPFGAVSGGSLRIEGPLARTSLIQNFAFNEAPGDMHIRYNGSSAGYYRIDTVLFPSQLRCKKPTYLLPVMLDMSFMHGWNKNEVSGLILQETECGENTFRRVGAFGVRGLEGPLFSAEREDGKRMLQEACRSQNGPDDDGPFPEWGKFQTITLI